MTVNCSFCGRELRPTGYKQITNPIGKMVLVHGNCEKPAKEAWNLTARANNPYGNHRAYTPPNIDSPYET